MDDEGLYLLLKGIWKQALIDAATPNKKCEHPPIYHRYKDCASDFIDKISKSHFRNSAQQIGLELVREINGQI